MNELGYDPFKGIDGTALTISQCTIDDLKGFGIKNNGKEIACVLKKV